MCEQPDVIRVSEQHLPPAWTSTQRVKLKEFRSSDAAELRKQKKAPEEKQWNNKRILHQWIKRQKLTNLFLLSSFEVNHKHWSFTETWFYSLTNSVYTKSFCAFRPVKSSTIKHKLILFLHICAKDAEPILSALVQSPQTSWLWTTEHVCYCWLYTDSIQSFLGRNLIFSLCVWVGADICCSHIYKVSAQLEDWSRVGCQGVYDLDHPASLHQN